MHKIGLITVLFLALVLVLSGCGGSRVQENSSVEIVSAMNGKANQESTVEISSAGDQSNNRIGNAATSQNEVDGISQSNASVPQSLTTIIQSESTAEHPMDSSGEKSPVADQPAGQKTAPALPGVLEPVSPAGSASTKTGPFTGTTVQAFAVQRPVMVMVENTSAARPQSGLEDASIVYEFLVEGGISRFLALYYEKFPERVGPIRSTRPYFIHTALEYDALLLHAGGSTEAYVEMDKTQIPHLDEIKNGSYFWRDPSRKAPHNLYTGLKNVKKVKTKTVNVNIPRFLFESTHRTLGTQKAAKEITLQYWGGYTVRYRYDEVKGSYLRYIGKEPHLMEGGKKLYANNIFVQYVDTKVTDAEGRLSMEMYGKGKAILFKNGVAYSGTWVKAQGEQTHFIQSDGTNFTLNPGQTWIQVVPISAGVDYQ